MIISRKKYEEAIEEAKKETMEMMYRREADKEFAMSVNRQLAELNDRMIRLEQKINYEYSVPVNGEVIKR